MFFRTIYFLHVLKFIFCDKINGVNIGGWLVLEPWITPSLFYQFLGTSNKIGMDMYSFCDVLGPKEGNKQLREHWNTWINETDIITLKNNNINLLRVPLGDWMYLPYGPFAREEDGIKCTDGSNEMLDKLFKISEKHDIKILLDLHGVMGSQNGFDNSGKSMNIEINGNEFKHWEIRSAEWIGEFDQTTKQYYIYDNYSIKHSIDVLEIIIKKYAKYQSLYGVAVLNEPWEYTPETFLKNFYQTVFNIFSEHMDNTKVYIIHDSFRTWLWKDFELINPKNMTIYIDTHQYTAWNDRYYSFYTLIDSSSKWQSPKAKYQYIVGEWSLAIDNCQMWLNGFMDNIPNYPLFYCSYQLCPRYNEQKYKEYLLNAINGPFGTGDSFPTNDLQCPISISLKDYFHVNDDESVMAKKLFNTKSTAFFRESAGAIFWNFKTETGSYQWDFLSYINLINGYAKESVNYKSTNEYDTGKNNYTLPLLIIFCILFGFCCSCFLYIKMMRNYKRRYYYQVIEKTPILDNNNVHVINI
jgi:glucan 1,3-beta-glucosidase